LDDQALGRLTDELVTALLRAEQHRKERLAADVHAAVCAAAGIEPEGEWALHIWTLIHEISEGNWAGGGKIIYYRQVKGLVADDAE
jgi:phenylpyruvate tautomerase PptA (4-oxalocrotonate tautomerase family)